MPAPTSLEVFVDSTEYSRYEPGRDRITASIVASGGAPYADVPVVVELVKARRSRNTSVASDTLLLDTNIDPASDSTSFYLPDIVDQDLYNLARHGKYFVRATYVAESATADIGSGANGVVTVIAPGGTEGNSVSVEVVVPVAGTFPVTISYAPNTLTISLCTVNGVLDPAQNQAASISTLINAWGTVNSPGFTAVYSGDGSGVFSVAEGPTLMSGGTAEVTATTEDFDIRIVTVARFRQDWLFGIPLTSTQVLQVHQQPVNITGVTVVEVSEGNPPGFGELSYNITNSYPANALALIGTGANGTVSVEAVNAYQGTPGNSFSVEVVVPAGTSPLSAAMVGNTLTVSLSVLAGVPVALDNTATLVAAAITGVTNFTGTASGTGASSLTAAEGPTALTGGSTVTVRTLSWRGGPQVKITNPGTYVLPAGSSSAAANLLACSQGSKGFSKDYIVVKVSSILLLPTVSTNDTILLEKQQITDATLGRYLDEAVSYLENDFLNVYMEPTVVVTDRDPITIQFAAGFTAPTPIYTDPDFDVITGPLTYYVPRSGGWVNINMPFMGLLRVDSLFGAIANTRIIDIDLDWVQHYHRGGQVQLVPYSQASAFNYLGLLWVNALQGASEVPNFWHFTVLAGLRDCPPELQEFIGKYAAINALTALALAFRPGIGSLSLSRDGVSQSQSFNTQATYGIYTGAIQSYKDWIKENKQTIKAQYKGATMLVC